MISKERLNALALDVADKFDYSEFSSEFRMYSCDIGNFAHALIKAMEAESEVVAFAHKNDSRSVLRSVGGMMNHSDWNPCVALPLVEGETN